MMFTNSRLTQKYWVSYHLLNNNNKIHSQQLLRHFLMNVQRTNSQDSINHFLHKHELIWAGIQSFEWQQKQTGIETGLCSWNHYYPLTRRQQWTLDPIEGKYSSDNLKQSQDSEARFEWLLCIFMWFIICHVAGSFRKVWANHLVFLNMYNWKYITSILKNKYFSQEQELVIYFTLILQGFSALQYIFSSVSI